MDISLPRLDIFGVSDHGLVFSKEARAEADAIYDNQIMERVRFFVSYKFCLL